MRQISRILICIFLLLTLSACDGRKSSDTTIQDQMPDIVFLYYFDNTLKSEYDIGIIDKEGKVYNTIDEDVNIFTIREEYQTIQSNEKWKFVKQVPANELKEKYEILKSISTSKNNIIHYVDNYTDAVYGKQEWLGYCYDKKENIIDVELYETGDFCYYNEDPRAEELADWICDIIGIEKVYFFEKDYNQEN